ncbi:outer membrane protein assembly factor BamD [Pseudobacteriovorax antillogorgiicola]|uniref:Outer membrane protein assembly factor BamD n=1 Tax=Pseudobacteriovorax antillogorgiicola TaxID=1513793 RepID=A0A1Y6B2R1_9BACT|nr:outer membrane protein assembly factor BamD [Pseudobacteriovorax antillogorgiicola]TCS59420.1 Beta-barrel assembly machine subunit BamD [Pseudobacteriovorax antillogorgiicola]SME88436.1 outer membrane protein assembly factor BamD [Pseudobacteriovorax antillogorgiicola]
MEMLHYSLKRVFIILFLLIFSQACQEKSFNPQDPADVFARASEPYEDGLYDIALQKLGEFRSRFPYSKHTTQAELMMANCHYELGNYQEAAFAYEQFVKLHPRHPKVDFALYRVGESYWIEAPEDIDREQDFTQKALTEWETLVNRFPNSQYSTDAKSKIKLGKKRIADSQVFVMNFYCKQERFHSCAYKALIILDKYKDFTDIRKQALKQAARSFAKLANQKAEDPESDKNVYVRSMSLKELQDKAATFKRLSEAS